MNASPQISVIIPAYNRLAALRMTLESLKHQTLPADCYEVIVVDDGSSLTTQEITAGLDLPYRLAIFRQDHKGPAAARNLGAVNSHGEVLLFLDCDMVTTVELLDRHLDCHNRNSKNLVVGVRSRLLGNELIDLNQIFDYRSDGSDPRLDLPAITFQEAFSCNLSISKSDWVRLGGFNESFIIASFEDIEFAYRAVQSGLKIVLNHSAVCFHNHPVEMKERCKRAGNYTSTVPLLYRLHPELRGNIEHLRIKEPVDWDRDSKGTIFKKLLLTILAVPPILGVLEHAFHIPGLPPGLRRYLYWRIIACHQWIGLRQGIREYGWDD